MYIYMTTVNLSSLAVLAHRLQWSIMFCCQTILQDSVKFQQETFSLFFQPQPELVLKLFLIFAQSELHCSYKVAVPIKKSVQLR